MSDFRPYYEGVRNITRLTITPGKMDVNEMNYQLFNTIKIHLNESIAE